MDEQPNRWDRLRAINRKTITKRLRKAEGATVRHARKFVFKRWSNVREVRRHIIMWVVAVGLLIGATGLQLMWYQQNYRTTAPATDGTYAEAVQGPIDTLDPLYASTSAEDAASHLLFSRLLTYDKSGHLSNDLATSVTVDQSGLVYTVNLRSDAKWHDGIRVTARDVVFTVDLLKNPAVRSTISSNWSAVTVTATGEYSLTFQVPTIIAAFPHALTFPILPEHILSKVEPNALRENEFSRSPIGSGPFKLRFTQDIDLTTGRKIVHMERDMDYYRGAPRLERFQLHAYGTQDAIVTALANGEVNAAADLSRISIAQINQSQYDVTTAAVNNGVYALFNVTREVLKDKTVRQALQHGTNVAAVRAQLGGDLRSLDLPFINRQVTGDLPAVPAYNVDEAKRLLDSAGWILDGTVRKKAGVEMKLTVVTTKDGDYEAVLETLAGQWRELGIGIDTQVYDPTDLSQRFIQDILQPRTYDVLIRLLPIGADPDVFAYWHSSQATSRGSNFSNYANAISDDALASARTRIEPTLRNAKYVTFARQWVADAPAIGLYQAATRYVSSKNAVSFDSLNSLVSSVDRYADVLYWSVGERPVFKTP